MRSVDYGGRESGIEANASHDKRGQAGNEDRLNQPPDGALADLEQPYGYRHHENEETAEKDP
jgi:hypothetical protein